MNWRGPPGVEYHEIGKHTNSHWMFTFLIPGGLSGKQMADCRALCDKPTFSRPKYARMIPPASASRFQYMFGKLEKGLCSCSHCVNPMPFSSHPGASPRSSRLLPSVHLQHDKIDLTAASDRGVEMHSSLGRAENRRGPSSTHLVASKQKV